MKKVMFILMMVTAFITTGFAKEAASYKSLEFVSTSPEKLEVKFRVNVQTAYDYLAKRLQDQKAKLQKEIKSYGFAFFGEDKKKKEEAKINLAKKEKEIAILAEYKGKTPQKVMVAGQFNAWKTLSSKIPNQMVGTNLGLYESQPMSFDRKSPKFKYPYKFVLYYGTRLEGSETTFVEYWIDDPIAPAENKLEDGFGGFNSFFKYTNN